MHAVAAHQRVVAPVIVRGVAEDVVAIKGVELVNIRLELLRSKGVHEPLLALIVNGPLGRLLFGLGGQRRLAGGRWRRAPARCVVAA